MGRRFLAAFATAMLAIAGLTTAASAMGWPQFGVNPGHTGFNPQETVVNSGNVANLTRTTTLSTPGEITDPVMVVDGIAYVNSIGSNALYAFDVSSGQQLWSYSGTNLDSQRGIAVAHGLVFVTCEIDNQHWGLCALKAKTGKPVWSWAYTGFQSSPQSPPAVSGTTVYFEEYETYGSWLTALDQKTGTVLWQFGYCQTDGVCDALGPNAPAIDGNLVFIGCNLVSGLQGICAVNTADGSLAWAQQLGGGSCSNGSCWGDGGGNLIAAKGVVYANYNTMNCYQCNYTIDAVALNETTGAIIWDTPMTPVLNNQYVYQGPPAFRGKQLFSVLQCCDASNDSGLVSLNPRTGKVQYHAETSIWLSSSPSLVNDVAMIQCSHGGAVGTLCAFHDTDGSLLWNSPDSGVSGSAPPTITGGTAYGICGYNDVCLYAPN